MSVSASQAAPDPMFPCCMAAAISSGEQCTCWEPVIAPAADPSASQEGPAPVRASMCHDCAYRPGSPERLDVAGEPLAMGPEQTFQCHEDMPRVIGWIHSGTGANAEADPGDYQPHHPTPGRAYRADGRPALLCAGWAASNRFTQDRKKRC